VTAAANVIKLSLAEQDRAADAAFQRICERRKQFVEDWLPFIDNVYAHSLEA
jgi:hypothetical protein